MPIPDDWDGIFYGKESGADLLFDLSPSEFAEMLKTSEQKGFAASLMANAAFDLFWNGQREKAAAFSNEGKKHWPNIGFGLEAVIAVSGEEMLKIGLPKDKVMLGMSNTMGILFGGPVIYPVT